MKKILIITYYWPPKGGVGVQRWLKLTKYLSKNNYHPIIYTADGGVSPLKDDSLSSIVSPKIKILKKKIFEPQSAFKLFAQGNPSSDILINENPTFFQKISIWLRANLFIPDSRCFWIKPSIRFLDNYLRNNNIDIVISTGPPHSMHMIALALKKKHNIKWIADFRDPWTEIEYFDKLPLLSISKKKHKKLEQNILTNADLVLSVSHSWGINLTKMGAQNIHILTNGYDPDDYDYPISKTSSMQFRIGHFGLYNQLRDHSFFWETIKKISNNISDFNSNLELLFAGEVHGDFLNNIQSYQLAEKLEYRSYLNHADTIQQMMQCDILLVTQSDTKDALGRLPAKFFEYLGARRPILAIGKKNSDLEYIINKISYAWFVDFNNSDLLYKTILKIYQSRESNIRFNDDISDFSREKHAKKIIDLMENI